MKQLFLLSLLLIAGACTSDTSSPDAYGHLEADSYVLSAEAQGQILSLSLQEGQIVQAGQVVGWIDTATLSVQQQQVMAGLETLQSKLAPIEAQLAVLDAQMAKVVKEQQRITRLLAKKAATQQQLDDLNGQVSILEEQVKSTRSKRGPILAEYRRQQLQLDQIALLKDNHQITIPVGGTVLLQYAEAGEVIAPGRPIAEIANLTRMEIRAYLTANQLSEVTLGMKASVTFPGSKESLTGTVTWISEQAEFTPKTIQTREERAHLVYAVRLLVPHQGQLKVGMPADITFPTVTH